VGAKPARVGLVVSERLVNLPVQLIPPMYDMLSAELDAAVKEVSRWRDLLATGLRADTRRSLREMTSWISPIFFCSQECTKWKDRMMR
jgi:hypothetical protein